MRILIELGNNSNDSVETESAFDKNYITYGFDGDINKVYSLKEYLEIIRPYLKNVTIDFTAFDEWKVQLIIKIMFRLSKDIDEKPHKYLWNHNVMGKKNNKKQIHL